MKRDLDLIRKLFFAIEKFPVDIDSHYDYEISIRGYNQIEIDFHLNLMKEANFISGIIHRSIINKHLSVIYSTLEIRWEGYEFFDSIRNNKVWRHLKSKVLKSDVPYSIIKEMAKILITNVLTRQLG